MLSCGHSLGLRGGELWSLVGLRGAELWSLED